MKRLKRVFRIMRIALWRHYKAYESGQRWKMENGYFDHGDGLY